MSALADPDVGPASFPDTAEADMFQPPAWALDPTKILLRRELATVLADVKRQARRLANAQRNLIIVRLACCCGLRVSEIAGLQLDDVVVDVPRPHLRLRRETTKGKRPRMVPLWWDGGTLADLVAWKAERMQQGAGGHDPLVCSVQAHRRGEGLQRAAIRRRFLSACGVLGKARVRTLTIHHGRHTFISHALAGGRTLAEVRAAAGHANVSVTSGYLHVVVDDEEAVGNLFQFGQ
jgi:integrase/recombinase XerD